MLSAEKIDILVQTADGLKLETRDIYADQTTLGVKIWPFSYNYLS